MRKKRHLFLAVLLTMTAIGAFALDNRVVDRFLEQDVADAETTIYMTMLGGEGSSSSVDPARAYQDFQELGFRTRLAATDSVTVAHFAHIVIQTMDIPGGVMYRVFRSPRYAFKDLVAYGILPATVKADDLISGETVVSWLGNVINWKERYR